MDETKLDYREVEEEPWSKHNYAQPEVENSLPEQEEEPVEEEEVLSEPVESEEEEEEIEEEEVSQITEIPERKQEKKKRKFGKSNVLIIIYLLLHVAYTVYMFTNQVSRGLVWLALTLVEILLFVGILSLQNKVYFLGRLLSFIMALLLVGNLAFSGFMLLNTNSSQTANAEYALVLGSQLEDNQMTVVLESIMNETVKYMQENPNCTAILCGGVTKGNTESEANVMRMYLERQGIAANRILMEDNSQDTIQNIHNAKRYLTSGGKVIVITANYNCFRAVEICREEGLIVRSIGAKTPILLLPDKMLHEKVSLLKLLVSN